MASLSTILFSLMFLTILVIVGIICVIMGGFFTDVKVDWVDCSALLAFSRSYIISLAFVLLVNYMGFAALFLRSLVSTSSFSWL